MPFPFRKTTTRVDSPQPGAPPAGADPGLTLVPEPSRTPAPTGGSSLRRRSSLFRVSGSGRRLRTPSSTNGAAVAAIIALIGFAIFVPIWLWRKGDVGKVLALGWVAFVGGVALLLASPYSPIDLSALAVRPASVSPVDPGNGMAETSATTIGEPDVTLPSGDTSVWQVTALPAPRVVALNAETNLRIGPGAAAPIKGTAPAGASVTIIGCALNCEWFVLDTGLWVAADAVDPPAVQTVGVGSVLASQTYAHAAPSSDSAVVATLEMGQCVPLRRLVEGWYEVDLSGEQRGWVRADALGRVPACPPGT
jgi:SH3-like domain-containing protein